MYTVQTYPPPPSYTDSTPHTTTTHQHPSSHTDKKEDISSRHSSPLEPSTSLRTTTILYINAYGKDWNDFSTHGQETQISITTSSNIEKYKNIRPDPSRGNCTLYSSSALSNVDHQPIRTSETTYRMGPGRPPVVKLFFPNAEGKEEEIAVRSKHIFSRSVVFESPRLGRYTWRYGSRSCLNSMTKNAESTLILERLDTEDGGEEVARMVRNRETRGKGTKYNEGNGGRLEMKFDVGGKDGEGEALEALVVSTCLVILKKEVDRLLTNQVVVVS